MSAANVTTVVNALVSGGVTSGVGLFVANWSLTEAQAAVDVLAAAGPFPVVGVQFGDAGGYDADVFSRSWLLAQSGRPAPPPPHPVPVPPVPAWQEAIMNALPTLSEGADDTAGHVFFVHRLQALSRWYGGFDRAGGGCRADRLRACSSCDEGSRAAGEGLRRLSARSGRTRGP